MNKAVNAEGEKYLDETAHLKRDPEAEILKEVMERCQRVIRREFFKKNAAAVGRAAWKAIKCLAAAALLGPCFLRELSRFQSLCASVR